MFSIYDTGVKLCDGISRRELLRAGGLGMLAGSPLSHAIASQVASSSGRKTAKRCIVLFLLGGPPQQSTWDLKPDAPDVVRGEIGPIETSVPGLHIGELLPLTAPLMHHVAVLRAVVTNDNAHSSSGYSMMTGVPHAPTNVENANPGAPNNWPTMGAVMQTLTREKSLLPPAIRLPHHIFNTDLSVWPGQDSGWLGHAADPWLFNCQPADPNFDVPQFRLSADVSLGRLNQRRTLLEQIEQGLREVERVGPINYDGQRSQALSLLSDPVARSACNLKLEPDAMRDRYGRHQVGQSVLLGRRMLEAGVKFVQVNWFRGADEPSDAPCWDSHTNETKRLRTALLPPFDQAYSALLTDLHDRGMLEETLVCVLAEFGRTPRINGRAGRDHWGYVFSVTLAGGGIRGGTVYGSSDKEAAYPVDGIVSPADITATIFDRLGYGPDTEIHDPVGRSHPISRGRIISEILA